MAFAARYAVSDIVGAGGLVFDGLIEGDSTGMSVAMADLNGDGFDDLVIGSPFRDSGLGAVFVVFGHAAAFPAQLTPASLTSGVGFRLDGPTSDANGFSVAAAGDVNGDGRDDLLIGSDAFTAPPRPGHAYLFYGQSQGLGSLSLGALTAGQGRSFLGLENADLAGKSVASAGDVNGDGFDDILIGAPDRTVGGQAFAGTAYLVFGGPGSASVTLGGLTAQTGMVIEGAGEFQSVGMTVAGLGDVNGDGFDDFALGSTSYDLEDRGAVFVVYGRGQGLPAKLDLTTLNGGNGFRINGEHAGDWLGYSVAGAGDVNGDGVADMMMSALQWRGTANPLLQDGAAYVIFGQTAARSAVFDLATLNGANGFRLTGSKSLALEENDIGQLGTSLASAGDVNGDGFDDVIVGARYATVGVPFPNGGQAFVVFGKAGGFTASFSAAGLSGVDGFRIVGDRVYASLGTSLAAGDLNGDGLSDIAVGAAPFANNPLTFDTGRAIVMLGHADGPSTTGADSLTGGASVDHFNGLAGNDLLRGLGGGDLMRGGPGADISAYADAAAQYEWWSRPDGTWRVKDLRAGSPEGTDILTDVESLQFSDKTVKILGLTTAEKLTDAYSNILRSTASGAELTFLNNLIGAVNGSTKTLGAAITEIVGKADQTTAVAAMSYQFFLNFVPSKGGFDYLVSPQGPNPNNINSAYYQSFNIENRYINFAVNLGKVGEGAPSFLAEYGGKTLFQATKDAYMEIFGGTVVDSKINTILDSSVGSMSRAQYFALYGGDGLTGIGTKAAMVGWLLTEAAKADLGMYAGSSNAFLTDLADGAQTLVDVVGTYGKAEYVFNG